jgi:MgtC family protein
VAGGLIGLDRGETRTSGRTPHNLIGMSGGGHRHDSDRSIAGHNWKDCRFVPDPRPDAFAAWNFDRNGVIGGGAILRRDSLVLGVTTAATLWFVTVIGLCFGGGQISLGMAAFVLGMLVLSGLRWFDYRMKHGQHGTLTLTTERDQPPEEEIQAAVRKAGYKISISSVAYSSLAVQRQLEFNLRWRGIPQSADAPPFLRQLLSDRRVSAAQWRIS